MGNLTVKRLRALSEPGRYGDGGGLYLVVAKTGTRSWIQRIRMDGKRTDKGLGGFPAVGLAEARKAAAENKVAILAGRNPFAVDAAPEAETPTFKEAACRFHEMNAASGGWTNQKNIAAWMLRARKHLFPKIGNRPVDSIGAAELRDTILLPVSLEKPETARRLRVILRQTFELALESEWIDSNPIDRIPAKRLRKPEPEHVASLPWQGVPDALDAIRDSESLPVTKLAFSFLILTAARTREIRLAEWSEIDLDTRTWAVPAAKMKAKREHRVPLSIQAQMVLQKARQIADGRGLVFPAKSGGPLSENALSMRARKCGLAATPHGFRSTFRDWAAETGVAFEVAETAIAHAIGTPTTRAYFRSDLLDARRPIMQAWADHVDPAGAPPF